MWDPQKSSLMWLSLSQHWDYICNYNNEEKQFIYTFRMKIAEEGMQSPRIHSGTGLESLSVLKGMREDRASEIKKKLTDMMKKYWEYKEARRKLFYRVHSWDRIRFLKYINNML